MMPFKLKKRINYMLQHPPCKSLCKKSIPISCGTWDKCFCCCLVSCHGALLTESESKDARETHPSCVTPA